MNEAKSVNPNSGRWIYSVASKITRNIPGLTLTIITCTLAAQISLLAASYLPLKAIILIGSPSIPSYFPEYFKEFEQKSLFVGLCIAAIAFYLLYLASESITKKLTALGSEKLVNNSSKLIVFDGQDDVARKAYLRFTRSLAAVVFLALTIAALGFIYLELTIAVISFWLCMGVAAKAISALKKGNSSSTNEGTYELINSMGSFGFLASFSYLAYDLLSDTPPSLLPAIIGVLLTRQIMQRATLLIQDVMLLKEQRLQISALFFNGHKLTGETKSKATKFWSIFTQSQIDIWVPALLNDVMQKAYTEHHVNWHQSGVHDVFALEVRSKCIQGTSDTHLIKIFNTTRSTLAINEATLLSEPHVRNLYTLPFVHATVLDGFHCHIFRPEHLNKIPAVEFGIHQLELTKLLMRSTPSQSLVQKYTRSRPLLWDRLSDSALINLGEALDVSQHKAAFEDFMRHIESIRYLLRTLPLHVCNSQVGKDQIFISNTGALTASYWGNWSLEPVGASLQISKKLEPLLPELLIELKEQRADMQEITVQHLHFSALCFQLDQFLARQNYISAAETLPQISSLVSALNQSALEVAVCNA
ncbi:hypothetical protein V0R39_19465 [Pseudomonas inefficax]|uniref:hypothetical protein n=1 Tax=Pseudomonas asiatica TaxID=2219225 RepID=UPI0025A32537|nr:hypothetical protein [Pseudomonas asiatica]MEE1904414.1 hypothetical protein [Pseudomonas inefficax]MEE1909115.1 hypothetical protein [Pseudomonas inefficax]MEE1986661.1 hypothetical protein [Pseudomonas inefficax]WJN51651.1 hypothetical protein QUR91_07490 [Pseudomonas asiatica]